MSIPLLGAGTSAPGSITTNDGLCWSSPAEEFLWQPGAANFIRWGYNPLLALNDQTEPMIWDVGDNTIYWGGP